MSCLTPYTPIHLISTTDDTRKSDSTLGSETRLTRRDEWPDHSGQHSLGAWLAALCSHSHMSCIISRAKGAFLSSSCVQYYIAEGKYFPE